METREQTIECLVCPRAFCADPFAYFVADLTVEADNFACRIGVLPWRKVSAGTNAQRFRMCIACNQCSQTKRDE
ncbi:hypothetical protein AJ87_09580 [Rhizobium yanglingense]|nr:hypothetical protein AJ87_09580 [Rhizobium yanglingense]